MVTSVFPSEPTPSSVNCRLPKSDSVAYFCILLQCEADWVRSQNICLICVLATPQVDPSDSRYIPSDSRYLL